MQLDFGKAVPIKPGKQPDKMFTAVFVTSSGNALSCLCRHDSRKFQIDLARAEKLNHLILKIEKLKCLFGVGKFEDKPTFVCAVNQKVLIAFTGKRFC